MDVDEFTEEQRLIQTEGKARTRFLDETSKEKLPRGVFLSYANGTCCYAMMSDDGRVVPLDSDDNWDYSGGF